MFFFLLSTLLLFLVNSYPNPPNFGPNIYIFTPSNASLAQNLVNTAYNNNGGQNPPNHGQWSTKRYGFIFTPGTYNIDINIGYYTGIYGAGQLPSDVKIRNVYVVNGAIENDIGALNNFWRSAEGFETTPTINWFNNPNSMLWAVSQAAPLRRVKINGNLLLFQYIPNYGAGYASGGYISDVKVTGNVLPGSQQQFYFRNCEFGNWSGGVWNMVFSGVKGAPSSHCSNKNGVPITNIPTTPIIGEKPYIVYKNGKYSLFIPDLKENSIGITTNYSKGKHIDFENVLVATYETPINEINKALKEGHSIVLCGGNYFWDQALKITKSNTIVIGIGFPVITPTNGNNAIDIASNLEGVKIANILLNAGVDTLFKTTTALLQVGESRNEKGSVKNPIILYDVFARVGGTNNPDVYQVSAKSMLLINTGHTIIDNTWLWRADHGVAGETVNSENPVNNGLIYNGINGTAYGLACEHTLEDCTLWNGEYGQVYFYQCELPYDVTQQNYGNKDFSGINLQGKNFNGYGFGVYCYFEQNKVYVNCGIKTSNKNMNINLINSLIVFLNGNGGINNIVNDLGNGVYSPNSQQYLCNYTS